MIGIMKLLARKTEATAGLPAAVCIAALVIGAMVPGISTLRAADHFEFRLADDSIPGETMSDVAQWFADQVTARSNGRLTIKHFSNSTLGTGSALVQGVQNGSIDMINEGASFYVQIDKRLGVLGLPFIFPNDDAAQRAAASPAAAKLLTGLDSKGIKALAIGSNGWIDLATRDKPVRTMADLKGLRLRALPSQIDIRTLTALGAVPVHLESSQLYLAVRQGTVDGIEATLHLIYKSKMPEVAKYVTVFRQSWLPMIFSVNTAQYNSLPSDLQTVLSKTAVEAMGRSWDEEKSEDIKYEDQLQKAGMQIIKLDPQALTELQKTAKMLYPEFGEVVGKENLDLFENM